MKKTILASLTLTLFLAISCKKDRSCECTAYENGVSLGSQIETISGKNKKDAEAECNLGNESESVLGVTYESKCVLK